MNLDGGHPGSPMNDLNETIQVIDIAVTIKSMKESSPDPYGLRLHLLRNIPVEVIAILCNRLFLKGSPHSRGNAGNIFTSRENFYQDGGVPSNHLEFRSIAIVNDFVRVFHCACPPSLPCHPCLALNTRSISNVLAGFSSLSSNFMSPIQIRKPRSRFRGHLEIIRLDIPRNLIKYTPKEGGLRPLYGVFLRVL